MTQPTAHTTVTGPSRVVLGPYCALFARAAVHRPGCQCFPFGWLDAELRPPMAGPGLPDPATAALHHLVRLGLIRPL